VGLTVPNEEDRKVQNASNLKEILAMQEAIADKKISVNDVEKKKLTVYNYNHLPLPNWSPPESSQLPYLDNLDQAQFENQISQMESSSKPTE